MAEGKEKVAEGVADEKPIKWKKLASRELESLEGMKLKKLLKKVLLAAGRPHSKEARDICLRTLNESSQFEVQDDFVKLLRKS